MWRSRSLAEWERKKNYLIRSLFEDIPSLSPILEGHEPTSSPIDFINRPESPLPELIIEVEARKPNPHDEPEELYDALAKEMRRLYRIDFLDLSASSSDKSGSESFNSGGIYDNILDEYDSDKALNENVISDKSQIDYDATKHEMDKGVNSFTQTEISTSRASSESTCIVSESVTADVDEHSQEFEIQEDAPPEEKGILESKQHRQSEEDLTNILKTTFVIEKRESEDGLTVKEATFESFARDTDASSSNNSFESSVKSSNASPELMRQRQPFKSLETPPHRTVSKSNSSDNRTINLSMEVDSRGYSDDNNAFNQEIELAESSINEKLMFLTSTPRKRRSNSVISCSAKSGHKRRLVSYSSSSSFASVANEAAQTSFSDCGRDWAFFWSQFFVGIPTVYNVCSCKNHVCT